MPSSKPKPKHTHSSIQLTRVRNRAGGVLQSAWDLAARVREHRRAGILRNAADRDLAARIEPLVDKLAEIEKILDEECKELVVP